MALSWYRLVAYTTRAQVEEVLLKKSPRYLYASCIQHDQDVITQDDVDEWVRTHNDEGATAPAIGTLKPLHTHILLGFEQARKYDEIRNWFKKCTNPTDGTPCNTFIYASDDPAGYEEYMTHTSKAAVQAGKHQYDFCELKVLKKPTEDFTLPGRKALKEEEKADENEALLNDILAHTPRREMVRKYGRDYMKNWQAYETFARMTHFEETGEIDTKLGVETVDQ